MSKSSTNFFKSKWITCIHLTTKIKIVFKVAIIGHFSGEIQSFLNFLLPHIFRDQELLLKYAQYSFLHLKISMNIYILYFDNLEDGCFDFICFLLYKAIFFGIVDVEIKKQNYHPIIKPCRL